MLSTNAQAFFRAPCVKFAFMGTTKNDLLTTQDRIEWMLEDWRASHEGASNANFGAGLADSVTGQAVGQWLNGRGKPSPTTLFDIEDTYGYSARWIATGEGIRKILPKSSAISPDELELVHIYRRLKTINKIAAETWKSEGLEKAEIAEWKQSGGSATLIGAFQDRSIQSGQLVLKSTAKQKKKA